MSFHRTGAYAINMGLGTDNVFRVGGWSASNNCLQMSGSGNITALGDFRAPVFYDSNNTSFYLDPASTSVINGLNVGAAVVIYSAGGFQYHEYRSDHVAFYKKTGSYNYYWRRSADGTSGGASQVELMSLTDAGVLTVATDIRAPIFYDSNNTAYYVNAAEQSILRNISLGGGTGGDATIHITGSIGGYDRLTQISPNAASKNGFNIMSARNGSNVDLWWSWGVDTSNRWRINQGVGFSTNGIIIDDVGNFTAAQNITAYSDIKLKKNIAVITDALNKVTSIRGVTFERVDTGHRGAGVIAQEIEKVLPEVVIEDTDGTKSVAYGNIVGLLIEAIKEQQAHINNLQDQIDSLRG